MILLIGTVFQTFINYLNQRKDKAKDINTYTNNKLTDVLSPLYYKATVYERGDFIDKEVKEIIVYNNHYLEPELSKMLMELLRAESNLLIRSEKELAIFRSKIIEEIKKEYFSVQSFFEKKYNRIIEFNNYSFFTKVLSSIGKLFITITLTIYIYFFIGLLIRERGITLKSELFNVFLNIVSLITIFTTVGIIAIISWKLTLKLKSKYVQFKNTFDYNDEVPNSSLYKCNFCKKDTYFLRYEKFKKCKKCNKKQNLLYLFMDPWTKK